MEIIRTPTFAEIAATCEAIWQPGKGSVADAAELHVNKSGTRAVFSGFDLERMEGHPRSRIFEIELETRKVRKLVPDCANQRSPKYSPSDDFIAYLSDETRVGDFQACLFETSTERIIRLPAVDGWIEYLHWSPDGRKLLLGVAGHGSDVSGGLGAVASSQAASPDRAPWMPDVETGDEAFRWRSAWIYDLGSHALDTIPTVGLNIWEASWCGDSAIVAITSPGSSEGLWYSAEFSLIDPTNGQRRKYFAPVNQIGSPTGSPDGSHAAFIHAICSDRGIIAGDLLISSTRSMNPAKIETGGMDVSHVEWRSNSELLVAGHRNFETVIGSFDLKSGRFTEIWSGLDTTGGRYARVCGGRGSGECLLVGESFRKAPEIARISDGRYQTLASFDLGYGEISEIIGDVLPLTWQGRDGLSIQGWLVTPRFAGPFPVVMNIHGGPVWHWRPTWLGRDAVGLATLALLQRGYAIFLPNPRGSGGRGQDFAGRVRGDLCGEDGYDLLAGLDALAEQGLCDPSRINVMGRSYGGCLTAWLITLDRRFRAAVTVATHVNQISQHLTTMIPQFDELFLQDVYRRSDGRYLDRSPIMFVENARTPTLNIAGALDRCTPASQAREFHNALREVGVESALVIYPFEGHGVRAIPAAIDYATRIVLWFEKHSSFDTDRLESVV